jgi:DNA-binding XRE family transcriptional regulator
MFIAVKQRCVSFMKSKAKTKKNNVTSLREDNAWSMAELARKAGVTPQTISKMEKGLAVNRISQLKAAKALGKSVDDVFA